MKDARDLNEESSEENEQNLSCEEKPRLKDEVEIETFLEAYKSKMFDFLSVFCHKTSVLLTKTGES